MRDLNDTERLTIEAVEDEEYIPDEPRYCACFTKDLDLVRLPFDGEEAQENYPYIVTARVSTPSLDGLIHTIHELRFADKSHALLSARTLKREMGCQDVMLTDDVEGISTFIGVEYP